MQCLFPVGLVDVSAWRGAADGARDADPAAHALVWSLSHSSRLLFFSLHIYQSLAMLQPAWITMVELTASYIAGVIALASWLVSLS